jgi:hypothetical protein
MLPLVTEGPITIGVLPHHHTVYCDRKRQVCTANGAVREGNRLGVAIPALGMALGDSIPASASASIRWYRSVTPAPGYEAFAQLRSHGAAASLLSNGTPASVDVVSRIAVDGEEYELLSAANSVESLFDPPPVPGLAKPVADPNPVAVLAAMHAATTAPDAAMNAESPLYSSAAALRMLINEAAAVVENPALHYVTLHDIGHTLIAEVTIGSAGGGGGGDAAPAVYRSPVAGPVEAAPPRIREIWVENGPSAAIGAVLRARVVYFGGVPGLCDFSWIRVDDDGNRTETAAVAWDPLAAVADPAEGAATGADPRALRLLPSDAGCMYKVTCEPVRWDGARGAPSTSKPTAEVPKS